MVCLSILVLLAEKYSLNLRAIAGHMTLRKPAAKSGPARLYPKWAQSYLGNSAETDSQSALGSRSPDRPLPSQPLLLETPPPGEPTNIRLHLEARAATCQQTGLSNLALSLPGRLTRGSCNAVCCSPHTRLIEPYIATV